MSARAAILASVLSMIIILCAADAIANFSESGPQVAHGGIVDGDATA